MEIPPVVNLDGHLFQTVLGSHKFSTQEPSSENGSPDHRGDGCLPEAQSCSLLDPDQDKTKLKNSFICGGHNNIEIHKTVCSEEPGQVPVIPGGEPLDLCPLASAHFHEAGHRVLDLPRIVKHKPSSITFSDSTCSTGADSHAFANESSDDEESSPEEEEEEEEDEDGHDDGDDDDDDDDDDNDVFPELPQSREALVNRRHRSNGKDKQKRRAAISAQAETDHTASNNGYEAEGETSSKEVGCS
ncbi:uncharacterized protein LOC108876368 isoform X2 [Lates calcarifer]|uniref:Uncharacterized protein LOC108876368 isoform X2 n=1 Tax=Lates calcarifer TaxID=8187 RepID=A0AAJ7LEG2_LATCA|nr:uncharacterized protein LOC108876368 isoform X2 [Lates calcarifer]